MTMNAETSDTAAATAAQGPAGAPEKGSSKKHGSRKKGAPKARKTAVGGMSKKAGKKRSVKPAGKAGPRRKSKGATILELIQRAKGATLAEIMTATGWQAHSVRGFISTTGKKPGIRIESSRNESGDRVYQIAK